jgi:N-alpha-acetyltransferase 40
MVKAKDLKLLRKKIEKADRMDQSTIQKCIDSSTTSIVSKDDESNDNHHQHVSIEYFTSADIGSSDVAVWKELMDLFEENMGDLYRQSSWGLDLDEKSREFQHRKARFLIVRQKQDQQDESATTAASSSLVAYCHYRFCLDDDEQPTCAVLYVYELQVASNQRRQGWGRRLMQLVEDLAQAADMPKVTLTVFLKNKQALRFYQETLHYEIDPTSPSMYNERTDYEILSKTV